MEIVCIAPLAMRPPSRDLTLMYKYGIVSKEGVALKITDALLFWPAVAFVVSMISLATSIRSFKLSRRVSTSDFQATQKGRSVETATSIAAHASDE